MGLTVELDVLQTTPLEYVLRKERSSTSHARNPFNLHFFYSAQCSDGPEVALNWLFTYPIKPLEYVMCHASLSNSVRMPSRRSGAEPWVRDEHMRVAIRWFPGVSPHAHRPSRWQRVGCRTHERGGF